MLLRLWQEVYEDHCECDSVSILSRTSATVVIQGGFCQQKHRHKNTDSQIGPGGRKTGREPTENDQKPRKPTETQGPWPRPKGFLYQRPCRIGLAKGSFRRQMPEQKRGGYHSDVAASGLAATATVRTRNARSDIIMAFWHVELVTQSHFSRQSNPKDLIWFSIFCIFARVEP